MALTKFDRMLLIYQFDEISEMLESAQRISVTFLGIRRYSGSIFFWQIFDVHGIIRNA